MEILYLIISVAGFRCVYTPLQPAIQYLSFPRSGARRYTQLCPRVVIPAGMPDPLERVANPVLGTVTRN